MNESATDPVAALRSALTANDKEPDVDLVVPHTGPPIELRIDWGEEGTETWPVVAWGRITWEDGCEWRPMIFDGGYLDTLQGFVRERKCKEYKTYVNGEPTPEW